MKMLPRLLLLLIAVAFGIWGQFAEGKKEHMSEPFVDTVFVGDSLTEGGDWNRLLQQSGLVNRGVAGDTHQDILRRIQLVPPARRFFILVGINDLSMGMSKSSIVHGIRSIVRALQKHSPDAEFYLQSVLPVNERMFGPMNFLNQDIVELNGMIERLAEEFPKAAYLDIGRGFRNGDGDLIPALATDGVHLSPAGYEAWADALRHLFPTTTAESD